MLPESLFPQSKPSLLPAGTRTSGSASRVAAPLASPYGTLAVAFPLSSPVIAHSIETFSSVGYGVVTSPAVTAS
jgi:hypothetical protein